MDKKARPVRQMKRITKEPVQRAYSLRGKMGPAQKCKIEVGKGHNKSILYRSSQVEISELGEEGLLELWSYS